MAEGGSCGHISGIVLRCRCRPPRALMEFARIPVLISLAALAKPAMVQIRFSGMQNLPFMPSPRFTLRNSWWGVPGGRPGGASATGQTLALCATRASGPTKAPPLAYSGRWSSRLAIRAILLASATVATWGGPRSPWISNGVRPRAAEPLRPPGRGGGRRPGRDRS